MSVARPETKYARSGEVFIAYQVVGQGPTDLIHTPGAVSHLEHDWEEPSLARYLIRLASFFRVILFDKRGTGLSDRVAGIASLDERIDDIRAVMDASGSERAALMGLSEGGSMSVLFAATYPKRVSALILYGSAYVKGTWSEDTPWAPRPEYYDEAIEIARRQWGTPDWIERRIKYLAPSRLEDPAFVQWFATRMRLGSSPGARIALTQMNRQLDIRHILPSIHVPTLVLQREGDLPIEDSRYLAAHIPGAKYVELPGVDHMFWVDHTVADMIIEQVVEFVTGVRPSVEPDRVLATVLFTDIVDSTRRAAELGDSRWRDLLDQHNGIVRRELERFRGREIHTTGDGTHAHFDGPGRAIRCARTIRDEVRRLGISIRAGLHTGEIEITGDRVAGLAVHIGARVAAQAGPDEVLVSSTVKDLVAGSGIQFEDRGAHALKGVPGEWRLFRVVADAPAVQTIQP